MQSPGGHPDENLLGRKGPQDSDGHKDEHEPAICP